ncbi:MAG: hypothetical protein D8M58_18575 [Calditrichaeota bacterium]|nr:MAG: hypothetical protein DWQ03_11805 [Calditrichota bacterium]MBL1207415.1 hypothetical protein [Calditrichota bacterium]NOG47247.1 hypothetical protein [Calditrichota bacterium]
MQHKYQRAFTLFLFLIPLLSVAQETSLVEIDDLFPEKVTVAGFVLTESQEVSIDAAAITPYRSKRAFPFTDAWILNSKTREVVWVLSDADDVDRTRSVTTFEDKVQLDAGNYEVYYSTFPNYQNIYGNWRNNHGFWDNIFGNVFHGGDWDIRRRDYRELHIKITGSGTAVDDDVVYDWQSEKKSSAILDYSSLRDDVFEETIMKLSKAATVKVYAHGEAMQDGNYDYGWIQDLKTREKVWEFDYRNSAHAGGASKNRYAEKTIDLDAGSYKVVFVTDDSHSYRRWNSAPPYDPTFWGIVIWPENKEDRSAISFEDIEDYEEKNVIVKFDRVRDRDYKSQGFTLNKSLTMHVYALGEGRDGEMYDYGWIVNANTREKVWEMDYYDTENAGGADKNRLFDGTITLDAGNYIAHYVSDGSHSYHRWNSSRPFDEKSWGMTISVLDDNYSASDIVEYDESNDESILVRITRVGDHDRARSSFSINEDQKVHIYAIGEGSGNEMYDYAWIENSNTGRIVWEMTYRKTERAGGARKNRLFDDNIFLEAGEYEVFYETDDSHSFADWNDSPPRDPVSWGITITKLDE